MLSGKILQFLIKKYFKNVGNFQMLVLIRRVKPHSIKRVCVVTPQRNKDQDGVQSLLSPPSPPKAGIFVCVCVERGGSEEWRQGRLERARAQSSPVWTDLGKQQERFTRQGTLEHHVHRPGKLRHQASKSLSLSNTDCILLLLSY